jgi:O-antigen ligase
VGIGLMVVLVILWREIRRTIAGGAGSSQLIAQFVSGIRPRFFLLVGMLATLMTALVLTGSRGGIAATCIGVLALGVSLIIVYRNWLAALAMAAVVAGGFALVGALGPDHLGSRIAAMPVEGQHRAALHGQAFTAIGERPIFGTGLGTYRDVYNLYKDFRLPFWTLPTDKAHNTYLELAIEGGLPALILTMLVFLMLIRRCLIGLLTRHQELALPALGLAVTALVGAHALVDFSLQIPAIAATYAYVMGIACAQSWATQSERAARALGADERLP